MTIALMESEEMGEILWKSSWYDCEKGTRRKIGNLSDLRHESDYSKN